MPTPGNRSLGSSARPDHCCRHRHRDPHSSPPSNPWVPHVSQRDRVRPQASSPQATAFLSDRVLRFPGEPQRAGEPVRSTPAPLALPPAPALLTWGDGLPPQLPTHRGRAAGPFHRHLVDRCGPAGVSVEGGPARLLTAPEGCWPIGASVITRAVSAESLQEVQTVLQRKPCLWGECGAPLPSFPPPSGFSIANRRGGLVLLHMQTTCMPTISTLAASFWGPTMVALPR